MIRSSIIAKLSNRLNPSFLEVMNDSKAHANHAAMRGSDNQESHFKIHIVSSEFQGLGLLARHRLVYSILEEEMRVIHALNIVAKAA